MVIPMKKRFIPLLLVLALLASLTLSACGDTPVSKDSISLVVILGYHANAYRPSREMLEQSGLTTLINHAIEYYKDDYGYCHAEANIQFILCDGQPEVVELQLNSAPVSMHYEAGNFDMLQQNLSYLTEDIMTALQSEELMANDGEVDLISALGMAGDLLRANPGVQNHILVLDAGLNTTGLLKMQDEIVLEHFQAIGEDTSATLTAANTFVDTMAKGAIVDLSNTYVTFYGLGNVDNVAQETIIDQLVKNSMINFWTAYLTRCGATLVSDLSFAVNQGGTAMVYNSDGTGYPYVSNVPFKLSEDSFEKKEDLSTDDTELVFNESTLGFNPSKATFRDYTNAVNAIRNNKAYFQWVLDHDENAIFYVVGSIARKDPTHEKEKGTLSLERAQAVAKIMVEECGVPKENIRIIAAGLTRLKWRDKDEFPNNQIIPESGLRQQQNRVVAIVPSTKADLMEELQKINSQKETLLSLAIPYEQ